ncbi:MAG: hypothetical protein R3B09_13090 [Nannocystaceae bacterium]
MRVAARALVLVIAATSPALACWGDLANHRLTAIHPEDESSSSSLGDLSAGDTDNPPTSSASTSTTSTSSATSASTDPSTSTDPTGTTNTTTTDPRPVDPPPEILAYQVSPTLFHEPGPLTVTLSHSDDVTVVEIYRGDALLRSLAPDSPTSTEVVIPIVNHPDNAGTQDVIAVVRDELGQEDSRSQAVTGDLPAAGTVVWHAQWTDQSYAEGLAVAAVEGLTVTAGYRVPPNPKVRPTMQGWTEDGVESWSLNFLHAPPEAAITALAERPGTSEFAVAGTITTPGDPLGDRAWVRMYNGAWPSSMILAEAGDLQSTRVLGAAVAPSGVVILVGDVVTKTQPITTDAAIWFLPNDFGVQLPQPFAWEREHIKEDKGAVSDRAHSAVVTPSGEVYVVGETGRRKFPGVPNSPVFMNAFVLHLGPGGKLLEPAWIAPMLFGFESGALRAALDPDGGLLVAGWSRHAEGATTTPLTICLGPDMSLKCAWIEGPKSIDTIAQRFIASPTGQTILAIEDDDNGRPRAVVRGFDKTPDLGPPAWSYPIPIGIDGLDYHRLGDLKVDPYGDIHFVGTAMNESQQIREAFAGKLRG